jgi:hypothetical protein
MEETIGRLIRQFHSRFMKFSPIDSDGRDIIVSDGGVAYFRRLARLLIKESWTESNLNFIQQKNQRVLLSNQSCPNQDRDQDAAGTKPTKGLKPDKDQKPKPILTARAICFRHLCYVAGVKEYTPTGATQATKLTDCNGPNPKGKLLKCKFDHEKDWLRLGQRRRPRTTTSSHLAQRFTFSPPRPTLDSQRSSWRPSIRYPLRYYRDGAAFTLSVLWRWKA